MLKFWKFILILNTFLIIQSCLINDEDCSKTGEIIGYDGTECMCCPGWIIKTGQDTIKVLILPIETQVRNIVETSGFPISVKLDYENSSGTCEEFYKEVTCIEVIK